jgi:D-aminopeptidase
MYDVASPVERTFDEAIIGSHDPLKNVITRKIDRRAQFSVAPGAPDGFSQVLGIDPQARRFSG